MPQLWLIAAAMFFAAEIILYYNGGASLDTSSEEVYKLSAAVADVLKQDCSV